MTGSEAIIDRARRVLAESRQAVVFTGAGISTESGIPDFRSPGGLWSRLRPIDFQEFLASDAARREAWRRKFELDDAVGPVQPNAGHRAVARLVAAGRVSHVITQNIDGLHQASGVPAERVIELHGNGTHAVCLSCRERYELADIRARFVADGAAPVCHCGGFIKSATVSFGQAMPAPAMRAAQAAVAACDLCLVVGSSLQVFPAAGFPEQAQRCGAALLIINREPTPLDADADLVLHGESGPLLTALTAGV
ncbi:MAG: SIR2 family NAD-dependent protein deacylase [Pseudomonadota bacterium]